MWMGVIETAVPQGCASSFSSRNRFIERSRAPSLCLVLVGRTGLLALVATAAVAVNLIHPARRALLLAIRNRSC